MTRTLICGWFSVDGGEATAGDLLTMEEVRAVASEFGHVDVATNGGFPRGVDWRNVDPDSCDVVVFACGPLHGDRVRELVARFPRSRLVAVNVSVVDPQLADRFHTVIARDAPGTVRPDLALEAATPTQSSIPVIGVVRSHAQPEYDTAAPDRAHEAIRLVLASRACAVVDFDTRVHPSADPLLAHARSPAEVSALVARMDAIVTTRLHGMVFALATGTPALAVDPVPGGGKILKQAAVLEWPAAVAVDELEVEVLAEHLQWCLGDAAREHAAACRDQATSGMAIQRRALREAFRASER